MDDGFDVGKHVCPHCGKTNDMVTEVGNDGVLPKDGDVGICIKCAMPFLFVVKEGDRLFARKATPDEDKKLSRDPQVQKAVMAIQVAQVRVRALVASGGLGGWPSRSPPGAISNAAPGEPGRCYGLAGGSLLNSSLNSSVGCDRHR